MSCLNSCPWGWEAGGSEVRTRRTQWDPDLDKASVTTSVEAASCDNYHSQNNNCQFKYTVVTVSWQAALVLYHCKCQINTGMHSFTAISWSQKCILFLTFRSLFDTWLRHGISNSSDRRMNKVLCTADNIDIWSKALHGTKCTYKWMLFLTSLTHIVGWKKCFFVAPLKTKTTLDSWPLFLTHTNSLSPSENLRLPLRTPP